MDDPKDKTPKGPDEPDRSDGPGTEEKSPDELSKPEDKELPEPDQERTGEKEELPEHAPQPVRSFRPREPGLGGEVEQHAFDERQSRLDKAAQSGPSQAQLDEQRIKELQERIAGRKGEDFSGERFQDREGVLSEHHRETMDKGGISR